MPLPGNAPFLESLGARIGPSVGLDPVAVPRTAARYQILAEPFRPPMPYPTGSFDVIVLLAVLEHIRDKAPLAAECARLLRPGGRVVLTVPSPAVDGIVRLSRLLRLADGMSLDEHHGYDPRKTPDLFGRVDLITVHHSKFQAGLNNLFVLQK